MALTGDDVGPLEQEALSHLLKFNVTCLELNGIVFDEDMVSVDLSLSPLDLYEVAACPCCRSRRWPSQLLPLGREPSFHIVTFFNSKLPLPTPTRWCSWQSAWT